MATLESEMPSLAVYVKESLPEKSLDVVCRRFGLRGHDQTTLEEVGKAIGLTRERVRQIQVEALKELKALLIEEGFAQSFVLD